MKNNKLKLAVGFVAVLIAVPVFAGEAANGGKQTAVVQSVLPEDPFAELLKNNPSSVQKVGPSCSFIRVELPPGVTPEEIPGLQTPRN